MLMTSIQLEIATAIREVMKLGEDTLWIHSTYPSSFRS